MTKTLILCDGSDEMIKKPSIKLHEVTSIVKKDLSHFVNKNSNMFFYTMWY